MARFSLRPVESFLGVDLKLGASVISLLGLLNKIAGVYGILAAFTGGSAAQISMYLYSIATLVLFLWGLRGIAEENGKTSFLYAHLYTLDHLISTAYTVFFAVHWWVFTPHDGRRVANSEAQLRIIEEARKTGVGSGMNAEEQARMAEAKWNEEKGFSAFVLVATWLIKIFFILILYSFAMHLRRGSYRSLPASKPVSSSTNTSSSSPQRRRASAYGYSHLRNTSVATENSEFELDDQPKSPAVIPPSPTDVPAAQNPISLPGAGLPAGPGMMRSRSTASDMDR